MADKHGPKFARASFSGSHQTAEGVQQIVAQMLKMAGCTRCGRLALLHIDFLSDPAPDLAKVGVNSFSQQGLAEV